MKHYCHATEPPLTGDAVICSSNTSTGSVLRILTSSMWNHSGIAVRLLDDGSVSLDEKGKLYILEMNTWERKDGVTGEMTLGIGYSEYEWMSSRYNIMSVRRMKQEYRTEDLKSKISSFVETHRGIKFTTDLGPFASVLVGIPIGGKLSTKDEQNSMFCSQFMSHFYLKCLDVTMNDIFGENAPELPQLCAPENFSSMTNSKVFDDKVEVIYISRPDFWAVVIPIIVITLFVMVLIWTVLPRS